MDQDVILAAIAMVSGGGVTAVIKTLLDHAQRKQKAREKDLDDRIAVWQIMSEKNESRLETLERKLGIYERDFRSMELYILALERTIIRAVPPLNLPQRPIMERDANVFKTNTEMGEKTT